MTVSLWLSARPACFAEQVDVRKLKQTVWATLTERAGSEGGSEESKGEPASPSAAPEKPAVAQAKQFRDTVETLKPSMPDAVTLPFYFITMLHLANERGLELEGREDLSDFTIHMPAEAPSTPDSGKLKQRIAKRYKPKHAQQQDSHHRLAAPLEL